jgi:hypothetical protein
MKTCSIQIPRRFMACMLPQEPINLKIQDIRLSFIRALFAFQLSAADNFLEFFPEFCQSPSCGSIEDDDRKIP